MVTFLRRIRQKLIDSGSVTKYLFYAIGEILLVVIGILLALQVNNWNEGNSRRVQEGVYLQLILDDLQLQEEENELQRSSILGHVSVEDGLVKLIRKKFKVPADSIGEAMSLISTLPVGRTYGAYEATFLDLTSSGNIALISDPELKNSIIQHYQIQKRDREVINNNTLNTYMELWTKLVDRNLILISKDLIRFVDDGQIMDFDPSLDFLEEQLFKNLSKDDNLILLESVLNFKIAATKIAVQFIDSSDARINQLRSDITDQIERN